MGKSDGSVGVTVSVLNTGPAGKRWNVLLMSDGYQASELSTFLVLAEDFVSALLTTPPFDAIDVESALNVWAGTVSSTESGVDDPVCSGATDPSQGTGTMVATYFDATLCADGIPRTMDVNMALVKETASLLLPQWHSVLIVVNSPKSGGSGWPAEGVGVLTTVPDWTMHALHEFGHAAFGLGDEYESEKGCDSGETGHDGYTPTQSMDDPNNYPNLTDLLSPLKWANLVKAGVNIPTTTNPDCSQCDPQPNPVDADVVGAFEGAGTFHCGLYRPQFDCLMRKTSSPFCAVCQQRIRETLAPYIDYVTVPADLATDVEPWIATLQWRAGSIDGAWDVQVSTTPDFSSGVTTTPTVDSTMVNSVRFGVAIMPLLPKTEYYWRVRKKGMGLAFSWTATRRFMTADKVCAPQSPWIEKQALYHPWALEFSWSDAGNAKGYEIEVFETQQDCLDGKPLLRKQAEGSGTSTTIDLKVKQAHWWRVRAYGRGDKNYGPWSACVRFNTSMPIVQLSAPTHDQPVCPWGIKLEWQLVKGAATYTLERTRYPEGFTADAPIEEVKVDHPKHEYGPINIPPQLTALNERYWWRVGVIGPQIKPEGGQPFQQKGQTSQPWALINDGDLTVPEAIAPMAPAQQDPPFVPYMTDVTFQWKHIDAAVQYEISLYPFKSVPPVFSVDWKNLEYSLTVNRNNDANGQQETFPGDHASAPKNGTRIYGYLYSVRAIGPEDMMSPIDPSTGPNMLFGHVGSHRGSGVYYIEAPPLTAVGSELIQDGQGHVYWNGNLSNRYLLLDAEQDPQWSPTGKYEIQLFSGGGCNNFLYWSGDNDIVAQTWYYQNGGAQGSYRMRTHGDYAAFEFHEPWSNCFDFTLVSEAEQKKKDTPPPSAPPAPVLFDEMGLSLGFVFISFMPVADATSYEADVYLSDCSDTSVESGPPIKLAWTSGQVAAETLNLTPKLLQHGWNIPPGSCHVPTKISSVSQTAFSIHVRAVNDGGPGPEGIWAFLADC